MAQRVRHLASLESVYVKARLWGFECWLISSHSTEDERFRLYDLEWELVELIPAVGLKFHLVDRQGRPLVEVLTLEPFDAVIVLRVRRHEGPYGGDAAEQTSSETSSRYMPVTSPQPLL